MVKNERYWQRNREKLDMYYRKNGRMDNIMDASYYKWLLWKMNLFQLKNKLTRPSMSDQAEKGRANGAPAAGTGTKTDGESQKNTSLNGQKAQEYEGLWPRWNVKNA